MKIIETRYITVSDLRALCIKNDWYTYGTNEEYSRLFDRLKDETGKAVNMTPEKLYEIAQDIKNASDWENTISSIMFELSRICCSRFEFIR